MSKTIYQTVYGTKIYPVEYIGNHELTENELNNLLDNNGKGLLYSLIIGMFKMINTPLSNRQIISLIKEDKKWFKKYTWKKTQRDKYENLVIDVYKNIYQYKNTTAINLAQWFMSIYGLSVEGNKIDL